MNDKRFNDKNNGQVEKNIFIRAFGKCGLHFVFLFTD